MRPTRVCLVSVSSETYQSVSSEYISPTNQITIERFYDTVYVVSLYVHGVYVTREA